MGRISIPKEMRDKLGLGNAGAEAAIELIGDEIKISNPTRVDSYETWLNKKLEALDEMLKDTERADEVTFILRDKHTYEIALKQYLEIRG